MTENEGQQAASALIQEVGKEGAFALGILLGAAIALVIHYFAGRERKHRLTLDLEREKELRNQLQLKDARISKLHDQISKLVKPKGN